ncbi:MAG: hypothetical protein KDI44_02475 [Thiothrix sp.]|nr:hypothetical protein [Thiothrix sp.]
MQTNLTTPETTPEYPCPFTHAEKLQLEQRINTQANSIGVLMAELKDAQAKIHHLRGQNACLRHWLKLLEVQE